MGLILSNLWQWTWFSPTERRILMLGLDGAGKTTILYNLKVLLGTANASKSHRYHLHIQLGDRIQAVPTIGFNVEDIQFQNLRLTVWDVGGQGKIRALWKHYFAGTDALIYVVDSSDTERLAESGSELHRLMDDDTLGNVPVLIFANKQDLPNASSTTSIGQKLGLTMHRAGKHPHHSHWYVQPCAATLNEGLIEGLHWLAKEVSFKQRRESD